MPAISVVLPFRNGAAFVATAIRSILAQDFADFELLAIDDASQDSSRSIVSSLARSDARIRVLTANGTGLPDALNLGLQEAKSRVIARMDADDVAAPSRFRRQLAVLERNPALLVVGSAVNHIDERGRFLDTAWYPLTPDAIRAVLASGQCCLCHPSTSFRRDAVLDVGGYRASAPLAEDFDLWLRLARKGDLANLDVPLLSYRLHRRSVGFEPTRQQIVSLLRCAALDQADLDPDLRRQIEASHDVSFLLRVVRPNEDPTEAFVNVAAWYVENAEKTVGRSAVRRLASGLARLAPPGVEHKAHVRLREMAAVSAWARGRRLSALSYLLGRGGVGPTTGNLVRAMLRAPRVLLSSTAPPDSATPAGYLDSLHVYDGGRCLLLFGWLPMRAGRPPREVRVVIPHSGKLLRFQIMRRDDVARAVDDGHRYSGFRLELGLDSRLDPTGARPEVWTRQHRHQPWRPMHSESVRIDTHGY